MLVTKVILRYKIVERFRSYLLVSDVANRLARGLFWSLVQTIGTKGFTVIQGIILAQILGITGFGEWGVLLSTIALTSVFANFGVSLVASTYVAKWKSTDGEKLGRLLGLLQLISIFLGVLIAITIMVYADEISKNVLASPKMGLAISLTGLISAINALGGMYGGVIVGLERFYDQAIIGITTTILGVVSTLSLALFFGVNGAIMGLLVTSFITLIYNVLKANSGLRKEYIKVTYRNCWIERSAIWNTALPTTLAALLTTPVYWFLYAYLVQTPDGYAAMGGYQAGNQWRVIVLFLPSLMLTAFLPVTASLVVNDPKKVIILQKKAINGISVVAFFSAFIVIILSPYIPKLYGDEFRLFYWVFILLAMQGAIEACNSVYRNTLIAIGKTWVLLLSNGIFGLISVIVGVFLIQKYLAIGLALAMVFAQTVHLIIQSSMTRYYLRNLDIFNDRCI